MMVRTAHPTTHYFVGCAGRNMNRRAKLIPPKVPDKG